MSLHEKVTDGDLISYVATGVVNFEASMIRVSALHSAASFVYSKLNKEHVAPKLLQS